MHLQQCYSIEQSNNIEKKHMHLQAKVQRDTHKH